MADIKNLEHPTLKVPYEILNKRFRATQKVLDREVSQITPSLGLEVDLSTSVSTAMETLTFLEEKLKSLKAKSSEASEEELSAAQNCLKRVEHLTEGCSTGEIPSDSWKKVRLDRMLVEYFLRSGFYQTAIKLADSGNHIFFTTNMTSIHSFKGDITDLTNIQLFLVAKEVEDDLAQKDVTKCLAWCHDNKSKLRKMKSTLEFDMRLQEFIELIKKNKKMDAVRHARKHLATEDHEQLSTVQRAMALLVFPTDTIISPYCEMLKDSRWNDLIQQFRTENYRLYQLSNQSVFTVALQVGLSALKTPMCYRSVKERNTECPVCEPCLNNLARNLPNAHCSHSRLICHITGTPLNENNPPLMLPNGYVYGEQALLKMAEENDGQVICPRTKEIYPSRDCEKVYVM